MADRRRNNQAARHLRMLHREDHADLTAVGDAGDVGFFNAQALQQSGQIVSVLLHGIRTSRVLRLPHTAAIVDEHTKMSLEGGNLEPPAGSRHEDAIGKHDNIRIFRAVQLVVQINVIDVGQWHGWFL